MRVVSLLASATEMIAALGCLDQLVGRSHECDYPPAVAALPVVSQVQIEVAASSAQIDAQIKALSRAAQEHALENPALKALSIYRINIEKLQQLQPDIIFTQTQCEVCAVSERDVAQAVKQLIGIQPRIISLAPYRLADVWEDVLRVGAALDREEQARQLVAGYRARLERLRARAAAQEHPRVAVLEWLDPLMAAGNWTPELVEIAGGINLFGEVGAHSPWLTWEALAAADPDVLILTPCGFSLERALQDIPLLEAHPAWARLSAVRNGRVFAVDGNQYFNRSGPRLVESAEILATLLSGQEMAEKLDHSSWQRLALP